jgi:sugar (pentulose or hexulose) kinase
MRVVGGGAKGQLWNQIKADVTGLPVVIPKITETTALGAALLALVGVGAYATLAEASERVVRLREHYEPTPASQAAYADAYALYRETYFTLLPLYERAAKRTLSQDQ